MSADDRGKPDISIVGLILLMWRERVMVISIVVITSLIGIAYALLATPVYKAEVVMTPTGQRSQSGSLAQLGNLAALAGVNIGAGSGGAASLAVLKSREFAEDFVRDMKLERVLVDDFDDPDEKRDIRDAVMKFQEDVVVISEDKKANTVTLAVFWKDSVTASRWANLYVERLNAKMRDQASAEAERNVKFLRQEMASTDIASMQQAVGRILETEMQKFMLAKGQVEFAYKIVDKAAPPKLRVWPRRSLIAVLSALFGGALAAVYLMFRHGWLTAPRTGRPSSAA
jgi:uncharacterized protein involved in exopolysaccharide biosynthesis